MSAKIRLPLVCFRLFYGVRNLHKVLLLGFVWLLVFWTPSRADNQILILYDSAGPYNQIGKEHSILLTNLLGHFDIPVRSKPVCQYSQGEMLREAATFYIGSTFEEQSYYDEESAQWQNYNDFLADAARVDAPIIWLNYNLHRFQQWMEDVASQGFADTFGFEPAGVLDNQYNRVIYKEETLYKGVVPFANPGSNLAGCREEGDGRYACATELNAIRILDSGKVRVHAWADSTLKADALTPYIVQSGDFWFVADLPFVYFSEEDRYLAFADLLHDMLGIEHAESHRALVRLEDVSVMTSVQDLAAVAEYLGSESVPFSVAVIPAYRNKLMYSQPLWLSAQGGYLRTLYRSGKASIVAHGFTHQRDSLDNPYNGVSGDDFEFYRVTLNPDNSLNYVGSVWPDTQWQNLQRMQSALAQLRWDGLNPFAWEAPHYLASENAYLGIRRLFPIHYGRMTYFSTIGGQKHAIWCCFPAKNAYTSPSPQMLGQFFPFIIHKDVYGYQIIPENIGNIEPEPFAGYRPLFPADLIRHAQKARVVRDGLASFFYHPDYGVDDLRQVVEGLMDLGYTFVSADSLISAAACGGHGHPAPWKKH